MGIRKAPLGCGCRFVKTLVIFGNFLLLALGVALLGVGIWVKMDINSKHIDVSRLDIMPLVMIAVGAAVCCIGLLGFCGACNDSRFLLGLYFGVLSLVLLGQIGTVIFGVVEKDNIPDVIKQIIKQIETDDTVKQKVEKAFDCRFSNSTNSTTTTTTPDTSSPSARDCEKVITDFLNDKLKIIIGCAVGFVVVQLIWLVMSCCLCKAIKKEEEQDALLEDTRKANRDLYDNPHKPHTPYSRYP